MKMWNKFVYSTHLKKQNCCRIQLQLQKPSLKHFVIIKHWIIYLLWNCLECAYFPIFSSFYGQRNITKFTLNDLFQKIKMESYGSSIFTSCHIYTSTLSKKNFEYNFRTEIPLNISNLKNPTFKNFTQVFRSMKKSPNI